MTENTTTQTRLSSAAIRPLRTLDPAAALDDLDWLDEVIGDARVVAIGESAHYNAESYLLRHRLLRYLVERHGFSTYAMESGFVEGRLTDEWIRGGAGDVDGIGTVMANGISSLMGLWTQMRDQLEWMRNYNQTAARPIGFYGIDLPGSNASLLPGLDAVIGFLAEADPAFDVAPTLREQILAFAAPSPFSIPATVAALGKLSTETKDALTAGLSDLLERMKAHRADYVRRTSAEDYERALHAMRLTVTLDTAARAMIGGDQLELMLRRDAAMADTVELILRSKGRIVLGAHNGHISREPLDMPGVAAVTTAGVHLADRLGEDYVVIGQTTGTGQTLNTDADFYTGKLFADLGAPDPGSLDALMEASGDGPFATDLRRLSPADADAVRAASQQRFGPWYSEVNALKAYDVIVHLPHVTAASLDPAALAAAPSDVLQVLGQQEK
ncbi:erythromycin esterase family protein [Nocardia sp. NPDC049707]|uniref:erythromycin esterase family protein n=1 Tax=Nocardia sp. NPDC049707 TaxID=3154735 RepID=UPI00341D55B0